MSASKLECMRQLEQSIHNLTVRWPCGIKSIDDEHEAKRKRLIQLLFDIYGKVYTK